MDRRVQSGKVLAPPGNAHRKQPRGSTLRLLNGFHVARHGRFIELAVDPARGGFQMTRAKQRCLFTFRAHLAA